MSVKNRAMVVSLIGRPNVGKSSLFNRLMKKAHKSITFDTPGVTRDRHYGITNFDELGDEDSKDVILVDTGGFYPQEIDEFSSSKEQENANKFFNIMKEHAYTAIDESDLVLFVMDVREGMLPFDESIANYIRSKKKKMIAVVNKYDSEKQAGDEAEFWGLGLNEDQMFCISAAHDLGIDDLRKAVQRVACGFKLNDLGKGALQKGVTPKEDVVARVALIGAPNAGKSTLLNRFLGAERALVSNIPGTTVDPIEGFFDIFFGKDAKRFSEDPNLVRKDGLLVQQYEDFRENNPDLYESLIRSFNLEEDIEMSEDLFVNNDEEIVEGNIGLDQVYANAFNTEVTESDTETIIEDEGVEVLEASEHDQVEGEADFKDFKDDEEEGSHWRSLHIVDTAGIRRQKQIDGFIESQSVFRSLRCITESDLILFMIDATKGISHQDCRLIDISLEKGKSVIVCLNKMDLMKDKLKTEEDRKEWIQDLRDRAPWLNFCDLVTISAGKGTGLKKLKYAIKKTIMVRRTPIGTGALNRYIFELIERNPIHVKGGKGKRFKVKYTSMVKTSPPTFLFFTNKSKGIPDNFRRYLKNGLRSEFDLDNTPIHLIFRTGRDLANRMKASQASKLPDFN